MCSTHGRFPAGSVELLAPERNPRPRPRPGAPAEFEDADFEVVLPDAAGRSAEAADFRGTFAAPAFRAAAEAALSGQNREKNRLDLFSRRSGRGDGRAAGLASPGFAVGLVLTALTAFWMTGGHALLTAAPAEPEALTPGVVHPAPAPAAVAPVEPPVPQTAAAVATADKPPPRPARIERAGSILMIRSGN